MQAVKTTFLNTIEIELGVIQGSVFLSYKDDIY